MFRLEGQKNKSQLAQPMALIVVSCAVTSHSKSRYLMVYIAAFLASATQPSNIFGAL